MRDQAYLRRGTVVTAYPALNTYSVLPEFAVNNECVPCTCLLEGVSTSSIGVSGGQGLTPGTGVYFISLYRSSSLSMGHDDTLSMILGPAPIKSIQGQTMVSKFPSFDLHGDSGVDYFSQRITDILIAGKKQPVVSCDRSYGIPADTMAGDSLKVGSFGSFQAISSSYAGIGGGASARLDFFSFKHKARLTAENLEVYSPVLDAGHRPDWAGSWLFFDRKAAILSEGLGLRVGGAKAFKKGDSVLNPLKPSEDNQQGIYRKETYFGQSVDGSWELWSMPETSSGSIRTWSDSDTPPLGVLSFRKSFSGAMAIRSIKSFSFVKSPFVPPLRELEPENTTPAVSEVAFKQWKDDPVNAAVLPYYHHLASTVERFETDYNVANYDNRLLRSKSKNWRTYSRDEVENAYGVSRDSYTRLEPLDENAPEYPGSGDVPELSKSDSVAGDQKFKLTEAIFKVLDDGTVVIGDGYGAEIRLSRGTITITCPGDLKVLPGRDLVEMTARNRVMNAGKDVYLQSANGSVYAKAERNMALLSGNGADGGVMLIENRSQLPMVNESWLKSADSTEAPVNHGIVIKSRKNAAIVSEDMYIGIHDSEDSSDAGIRRTKAGRITVDSAGGLLALIGNECYAKFKKDVFLGAGEGSKVSALAITKSGVACHSIGTLGIIARSIAVAGGTGSVSVPELTASGIVSNSIQFTAGRSSVMLDGSLQCTGPIVTSSSLRAVSVNAGVGSFGNGGRDYWGGGGSAPPPVVVNPIQASAFGSASVLFETSIDPAANALYTGKCIRDTGFFYPGDARLGTGRVEIVAARWQHMMNGGNVWRENVVKSPDGSETMIWPGKSRWEAKSLVKLEFDGILKDKSVLMDKYTINCSQI